MCFVEMCCPQVCFTTLQNPQPTTTPLLTKWCFTPEPEENEVSTGYGAPPPSSYAPSSPVLPPPPPQQGFDLEIKNSLSMIILIIPPQQGYSAAQLPPPPPPPSSLPAPLPFPSENEVPAYPPPPSNYGAIQIDQIDEVLLTNNQKCFVLEPQF